MYLVEPMEQEDVEAVSLIERRCFTNPWPISAYRRELRNPNQNAYFVLRHDPHGVPSGPVPVDVRGFGLPEKRAPRFAFWHRGQHASSTGSAPIIGFAGMWHVMDEAHVTTIGVDPAFQGRGLGELLFVSLVDETRRRRAIWLTLEVRVSNFGAQALYRKYGFSIQGTRRGYYSDNHEDAYIMWSESFRDPEYLKRIETLRRRLYHKLKFIDAHQAARP